MVQSCRSFLIISNLVETLKQGLMTGNCRKRN